MDARKDFFAYGDLIWKDICKQTYQGYITGDGESFIRKINDHGICLVLHSEGHLNAGIPSGRIFEAAAARAIIISDQHLYVKNVFKDNVFYIDQTRNNLYEEVKKILELINQDIPAAINKANNAYKIFVDSLTLERQLELLEKNLKSAGIIKEN